MKLSLILLSSILLASFACKREDGPITPGAGSSKNLEGEDPPVGEPPLGEPPIGEPRSNILKPEGEWAHAVAATLQSYYVNKEQSYYRDETAADPTTAHALTALIDFMKISGSREYMHVPANIKEKYPAATKPGVDYFSNYLWATAWIAAYDLSADKRYLGLAQTFADHMSTGWDLSSCNGGIISTKATQSPAVAANKTKRIANSLAYIQLMGALHNRISGDSKYLAAANKAWTWFVGLDVITNNGMVHNGLTANCKNDGAQQWSHAQGLLIAAALEMNKISPAEDLVKIAKTALASSLKVLDVEGTLKEFNDRTCNPCMAERSFKGIFIRSLRIANEEWKDEEISTYFNSNAHKVWNGNRSTSDMIGFHWHEAFDSNDAGRQAAALDLMNAVLVPSAKNLAEGRVVQTTGKDCATTESGAQALDGMANSKWCVAIPLNETATFTVDLGSEVDVKRIKILHGGSGGENLDSNTRDFTLSSGTSATGSFSEIVKVENNTSSASFHPFVANTRFIRMTVTKGGADNIARIYEFHVE